MTSNALITLVLEEELYLAADQWGQGCEDGWLKRKLRHEQMLSPPPPPLSPQRSCAFVPHCPGHNGHNGQAAGGQQGEEEERGELLLHWAGHHSLEPSYFNCPEDNNLKFVFHSNCTKSSLDQCILLLKVDVSLRSQSTSGWSKFFQVGINWVEMLAMQSFFVNNYLQKCFPSSFIVVGRLNSEAQGVENKVLWVAQIKRWGLAKWSEPFLGPIRPL